MLLLVFGGWGQLGADLVETAAGRHEVVRPSHEEVDVTDAEAVTSAVLLAKPDVVLDLAAFHRTEQCEREPERAFSVNAVGALNVARAAAAGAARCVYVSTDYVFAGTNPEGYAEDDPVGPVNVYGASKAAGEWLVRTACPDSLVVRGSGLYGHAGSSGKGGNFVETMLAKAAAAEPIAVVDDQFFSPTATRDMAERLCMLLERSVSPGIYHAAGSGSCSWFEFAAAAFELAGVKADLTPRPTVREEVRRPRYSILRDTRSESLGLPPNRPWLEALARYLSTRPATTGPRAVSR
jgi:dTDP-4-dehydrorhamnose reductase